MRPASQFAALLALIVLGSCGADPSPSPVNQQPTLTAELVAAAELIFVGRIVGLADSSPEAQKRRHLETHLIDIQEMLKGSDVSGQRFAARPEGATWQDGSSYVLLMRPGPGNVLQPLPQPLIPATPDRVTRVRQLVQETGGAVTERRVFWMAHSGGPAGGSIQDFSITASGRFDWRRTQPAESLTGVIPSDEVAGLTRQVQAVDPGPPVDDGDVAVFGWLDEKGARHAKSCTLPARTPCGAILETVERLARQFARQ